MVELFELVYGAGRIALCLGKAEVVVLGLIALGQPSALLARLGQADLFGRALDSLLDVDDPMGFAWNGTPHQQDVLVLHHADDSQVLNRDPLRALLSRHLRSLEHATRRLAASDGATVSEELMGTMSSL